MNGQIEVRQTLNGQSNAMQKTQLRYCDMMMVYLSLDRMSNSENMLSITNIRDRESNMAFYILRHVCVSVRVCAYNVRFVL